MHFPIAGNQNREQQILLETDGRADMEQDHWDGMM